MNFFHKVCILMVCIRVKKHLFEMTRSDVDVTVQAYIHTDWELQGCQMYLRNCS